MAQIKVKVRIYQAENKDGKKFNYYKVVRNDGVLVTCKFRQFKEDGKTPIIPPTETCNMIIDDSNVNYTTNTEYPTLWVRDQPTYEAIEHKSNKVSDAFGQSEELVKDDLPFDIKDDDK